ncbi:MAG TPA: hypothetical protein VK879_22235 [Candidatus Sulfomarinibacteraceae bacterium]|nr:hypothetical protein [Candidatus Sulfomarinibacteraceae bacterium]
MTDNHFLTVDGAQIVNRSGDPVFLRGVNFGGWMNMENFIAGYPAANRACGRPLPRCWANGRNITRDDRLAR